MEAFVVCASGLESLLMEELKELGIGKIRKGFRGVYVPNEMNIIYTINYCSRIAIRVLKPLIKFYCKDAKALYTESREIDWCLYLDPSKTFAIDSNVSHPLLRNSLFAAQVLKDAICDTIREAHNARPSISVDSPDVQLNLFIQKGMATISFDTSGTPLYKRGYRYPQTIAKDPIHAPIQESLAAAILRLAKYSKEDKLCDPCCGSGTFLIEAAMVATNTPAGFFRKSWGFKNLPEYVEEEWLEVKKSVDQAIIPLPKGLIMGADKDLSVMSTCKQNLLRAGFAESITIQGKEIERFSPIDKPSLIVCNPPYGRRLPVANRFYLSLAQFMQERCSPQTKTFVLSPNLDVEKKDIEEKGLSVHSLFPILNGGLETQLYCLE
ncbi:MAG: 50S rRNA methyltransferase [Chlamydiales bacterium]|nr:50S rRNA methyltransferase [Chlamydiales bacterium]